jgi:hypothetical protein
VVKNASKIWAKTACSIPLPVSETVITAESSVRAALMVIVPPPGSRASRALRIRFMMTCCI